MGLRKRFRDFKDWCPQPTKPVLNNSTKLSSPVVAGVLFIEIVALLIAPMAYLALFPPVVNYPGTDVTFPLSSSQIASSWPNLPTANQIAQSGIGYVAAGPGAIGSVVNCTAINLPDYLHGGLIPLQYDIWLQYNGTWIQVPPAFLGTDNPPPIPKLHSGFLGTGLPTEYFTLAVIAIVATSAAGTTYLRLNRKAYSKTGRE
jgi:hypothetical protein